MGIGEKIKSIKDKMRPMDYIIIGLVVFVILIFILFSLGKEVYSPTPVENEGKVTYEIFFKNVLITGDEKLHNPFKVGDETFVTIRNEPHAKLKIVDVKYDRKVTMIPTGNSAKPYIIAEDMENPCAFDFVVKVEDTAKFTKDGVVSGGNKIKVGLPITLESAEYRLNGVISSFEVIDLKNKEDE